MHSSLIYLLSGFVCWMQISNFLKQSPTTECGLAHLLPAETYLLQQYVSSGWLLFIYRVCLNPLLISKSLCFFAFVQRYFKPVSHSK